MVVYARGQGLPTISYLDRLCDPLSYPLLFPRGEDGWHPGMEKTVTGNNRRTRVTHKEFYSYLLTGRFNPLLHAEKLFQQYVVDSWLKIEMNRLNFLRKNQKELRLDTVRGLHDYMIGDNTHDGPPGRRIILTASFTGGPRHMIGQYQDAMSFVSIFKNAGFLTRITLKQELKLNNADQIDQLISGELPDPDSDPELFEIVSKNMIHRPCGNLSFTSPCMQDGVCTKRFPKNFRSETSLHVDGYPEYRRRDDGRYVMCRGVRMDNRSVVPYCPYLTRMFEAHINFMQLNICSSTCTKDLTVLKSTSTSIIMKQLKLITTKAMKKAYIDARYVCAPEAPRIIGFKMQCRSDAVQRLQVHLPGFEAVTFEAGAEQQALNAAQNWLSTLTGYFAINKTCNDLAQQYGRLPEGMVDSRSLHYYEMPQAFEFNKGWRQRKKYARTIGRMYFVGPQEQERFALRLLLLYGKGFTSFEDVRTVEGVLHTTFVSAARAAGYLTDDTFFVQSLSEAASFHLPAQLRSYFVSLIVYGNLQDPLPVTLWNAHKEDFMEDFVLNGDPTDVAESKAFYDIAERISILGKDYREYLNIDIQQLFVDDLQVDVDQHNRIGEGNYALLNSEQKSVVDDVLLAIERQQGQCFLVDGPGGSGKTFVYTTIYHLATARRKRILNVAWT
ncbi:unnamed protein product [Heligmosomoides polygyrus]|uniref:ATP-dependent DNA helicase n=1 Tax=Heligmosomoides polygyrus TaxID=6339 RepID=A0A183GM65_HELPZ|nr:unnamed protein product [Heligmosomoides polygyrus]